MVLRDRLAPRPLEIGRDRVKAIPRTIRSGWKWARSSGRVRAGMPEAELNECLRDGMRAEVEPRVDRPGPRMQILPSAQTRSGPKTRAPDGVPDIPISFPEILERPEDHDPHALIECKRVAGDDRRRCRDYVRHGIDRFASGKNGARHVVGFMVGYLESGGPGLAAEGINRVLADGDRYDEMLQPAAALAQWARRSRHARGGTSPIELNHAFLGFA